MRLTPTQVTVLTAVAERDHADGPAQFTAGHLRSARTLANLGYLAAADADERAFTLTGAGADTYHELPATARTATGGRLTAARYVLLEQQHRDQVLAARRAAFERARTVEAAGDVPEQDALQAELDGLARAAEHAYTDLTGADPYVGLLVTIPETGDHEWRITSRSPFHGTVELTSTITGVKHTRWLLLDFALYAAELAAAGLPTKPGRAVPATFTVERDDLRDGESWVPVAKGNTTVAACTPIDLGVVAREIEEAHRGAGCPGVDYRVTVVCYDITTDLDRFVTAHTPPDVAPCYCGACPPRREPTDAYESANDTVDVDGPIAPVIGLPSSRTVTVWQTPPADPPAAFIQLDDGPLYPARGAGRLEHDAEALAFGDAADRPTGMREPGAARPAGTAGLQRAATWTLRDKTVLHVDRNRLNPAAAAYIDVHPEGVDPDAWAVARDLLDQTLKDEMEGQLAILLRAIAVRTGRPGLALTVADRNTGEEVFAYRQPA